MDRLAYPPWQPPTLRAAPLILWGIGEVGGALARFLIERLAGREPEARLYRLFAPAASAEGGGGGCEHLLRECVVQLADHAGGRAPDFETQVLMAAWEMNEAEHGALLTMVSETLGAVLPGNQSLRLAVLVPPPTAGDDAKRRVYRCFLELEKRVGTLPFLNAILVYQLPAELFQASERGEPDLRSAAETPDLVELLLRESVDAELVRTLQGIGYPVIRNRLVNGRKAGYSALGAQRLLLFKQAMREHLEARFQHAVYQHGLNGRENLTPDQRTVAKTEADRLLRDGQSAFEEQYQGLPVVVAHLPAEPPNAAESEPVRQAFETAYATASSQATVRLRPFFRVMQTTLREALDHFLVHCPTFLAGGRCYLEALAAGLAELRQSYDQTCAAAISGWYERHLTEFSARFGVALVNPGLTSQQPREIVRMAVEVFQGLPEFEGSKAIPLRFLAASWLRIDAFLERELPGSRDVWQLIFDTFGCFLQAAGELAELLEENQRRLEALREELALLRRRYPWLCRWIFRRAAYLRERDALLVRLAAAEQERRWYQEGYALLCQCYRGMVDTILWPHGVRLLIVEGFRERLNAVTAEYDDYCGQVEAACAGRWRQAESVPEIERWTATSIVTPAKLDHLFERIVGSGTWLEWAKAALAYLPPTVGPEASATPAYGECRDLRDHCRADPRLLLERLADFTARRVASLGELDALDLIEVGGEEQAQDFLKRMLAKAERLPEFAPALLPVVNQQGLPKRVRIIRCTPRIREGLRSRYGYLFGPDDGFLDSADPELIDITAFAFGFPAFLLHVLQDARRQLRAEPEAPEDDLWLRSTP